MTNQFPNRPGDRLIVFRTSRKRKRSMFTVKWIVKQSYGEVIRMFEADEVSVAFADASVATPKGGWSVAGRVVGNALLIMDPYDIGGRSLADGTVYVMNEAGATVGKYLLSDEVVDYAPLSTLPAERIGGGL